MLKMDTYLRWISTIHNIYTTLTTTTHSLPSRWRLVVKCIYPLSRQPSHRLHLKKLTPNLRDKVRYVVHYRNLKLYLQLGLVVTRIHRVLMFKRSTWLKTYIDFNTHQRSLVGSSFLKDFFKLMNNSVFWKAQENLRKRVQVELITECLTAIQCTVTTLTQNRPIYVGFSVLDLVKLHMYNFHYNRMCVKYPRRGQLRLLLTDTDNLAYAVQTENIYKDMAKDAATYYD